MKLFMFTLIMLLFVLPMVEFDLPIQTQKAEASGVHWFFDYHWQREYKDMSYWPHALEIFTVWHWHFWEWSSIIPRSFHWRSPGNAYYSAAGWQDPSDGGMGGIFGRRWPTWHWKTYPNDWDAIHRVKEVEPGSVVMDPEPKWFKGLDP